MLLSKIAKLYDNIRKGVPYKKEEPDITPRTVLESKKMADAYYKVIVEKTSIIGKPERAQPEVIATDLSDGEYRNLKRQLGATTKGGFKEIIDKILKSADWGSLDNYDSFLNTITNIFIRSDIEMEFVKRLFEVRKTYDPLPQYLQGDNVFSLKKKILDPLNSLTGNPQALNKIFDEIWVLSGKINTVAVGKGEICITFFTNSKKGSRGDLFLTTVGEVELKGAAGRPGSKAYALGTPKRLFEILKKRKINLLKGKNLSQTNSNFNKKKKEFDKKYDLLMTKKNPDYLKFTQKVYDIVNNSIQTDNLIESTKELDILLPPSSIFNSYKRNAKELIELFFKLSKLRKDVINVSNIPDQVPVSFDKFGDAVIGFFKYDYGLSKEELIKGFFETRNHELDTTDRNKLFKDVTEFLSIGDNIKLLREDDSLKKLIISLHIACYYLHHKFSYLLLVNDKELDSYISYSIGFENEGNLFADIYRQLQDKRLSIGLSVDASWSNAITVTING